MSEVCVTYIHRVFCIVNEETGEIDRVLSGDDLTLDEGSGKEVYDLDAAKKVSRHSDRAKRAIEIAESADWPAWDY
jgi:hypothetical protein